MAGDDERRARDGAPTPTELTDPSSPAWSGVQSSGATAAWLGGVAEAGGAGQGLDAATDPTVAAGQTGGAGAAADDAHPFAVPDHERYAPGSLLGIGGMGRVLVAEDRRLRREVALKEASRPDSALGQRLAQEAWITAQLEHPGIVPVHDAGVGANGRAYYTMRVVPGRSLAQAMESGGPGERRRLLRHIRDVAEAVAFAHSCGIVHRDLKPANVMVGEFGETQVLDWGLARPDDEAEQTWAGVVPDGHAVKTQLGSVVGTPAYMSPEQARGERADRRSDVWALGAMLFELISGAPPFGRGATAETLHRLRTEPPPPVAEATPDVPADLAALIDRALARDPEARYPSAQELATDLDGYLDGRRVAAHAYAPLELLVRAIRAYRAPLAVGAVALVALAITGVVAYRNTTEERNRAVAAEADTRAALGRAQQAEGATRKALGRADRNLAQALAAQALEAQAQGVRPTAEVLAAHALALEDTPEMRGVLASTLHGERPVLVARAPWRPGGSDQACDRLHLSADGEHLTCVMRSAVELWRLGPQGDKQAEPGVLERLLRWEGDEAVWDALYASARGTVLRSMAGSAVVESRRIRAGSAGPPETVLARGMGVYELRTGPGAESHGDVVMFGAGVHQRTDDRSQWTGREGWATKLSCSRPSPKRMSSDPTRRRFVMTCDEGEWVTGRFEGLQVSSRRYPRTWAADLTMALTIVPAPGDEEPSLAIAGTTDGDVLLVGLDDGEALQRAKAGVAAIGHVSVSTDGRWAVVTGDRAGADVFRVEDMALVWRLPGVLARAAVFAADGTLVTVGDEVRRWRLPAQASPSTLNAEHGLSTLAVSPDGRAVALATGDGRIQLRDVETGATRWERVASQVQVVKDVAFTPGGEAVIGVGPFPLPKRVGTARGELRPWMTHALSRRVAILMGDTYLFDTWSDTLRAVDGRSDTLIGSIRTGPLRDLTVASHRGWAIALAQSGQLLRIDASAPGGATPLATVPGAYVVGAGSDRDTFVVGTRTSVALWSGSGDMLIAFETPRSRVHDVTLSADGRFAAAGFGDGAAWVWRTADGAKVAELRGHTDRVSAVAFTPGGDRLLTASWDGTVGVWAAGAWGMELDEAMRPETLEKAWGLTLEAALAR